MNEELSEIDKHIGQRLQQLTTTDQAQKLLAEVLGIDHQTLLDLQAGRKRLRARQMLAVAATFAVPISFFFIGCAPDMDTGAADEQSGAVDLIARD